MSIVVLHCTVGTSNKIWALDTVCGPNGYTTWYGRYGTRLNQCVQNFNVRKKLNEKLAKGYVEVEGTIVDDVFVAHGNAPRPRVVTAPAPIDLDPIEDEWFADANPDYF